MRIAPHVIGLKADRLKQFDHPVGECPPRRRELMDRQRLADDCADRHARIERGERVLEDDLHVAAERSERPGVELGDVAALEPDFARRRFDQPQDAAPGRRLTRAGLAHQPERLALGDVEADTVDRMHGLGLAGEEAAADLEVLGQVLHAQQRLGHVAAASSAGSTSTQATRCPPPMS